MTTIERNQLLIQDFERILQSEDLISLATHSGLIKLAKYSNDEGCWKTIQSEYDSILGSILDVDVNNQQSIDVEVINKEILEKIKHEASWMIKADFETVIDGLKEIEEAPIASLKKDEAEYGKIRFWQEEIVEPWLAAPVIFYFQDYQEKMKKASQIIENYTDIKLYFDSYVNKILPTYRSLLSNDSMKGELSDEKKQNFIENMEYLKKLKVKEARKYLKEQAEITMDKIYILFKNKVSSSEELIELLNK
jgi:hypothetical protein